MIEKILKKFFFILNFFLKSLKLYLLKFILKITQLNILKYKKLKKNFMKQLLNNFLY